jgi:hypothetical protein
VTIVTGCWAEGWWEVTVYGLPREGIVVVVVVVVVVEFVLLLLLLLLDEGYELGPATDESGIEGKGSVLDAVPREPGRPAIEMVRELETGRPHKLSIGGPEGGEATGGSRAGGARLWWSVLVVAVVGRSDARKNAQVPKQIGHRPGAISSRYQRGARAV